MFKIGAFSKITQVSIRMLRYYDETGLLKPAQVDSSTGYRSYSAQQIPQLQKILLLRDLGYNVTRIAEIMKNEDETFLMAHLQGMKVEIENNLKSEAEKLSKIDAILKNPDKNEIEKQSSFTIKQIPAYLVVSLRRVVPNYYCEGLLWKELSEFCRQNAVAISADGYNFAIYHDDDFKEENVDIEVCTIVDKIGKNGEGVTFRETEVVDLMACNMVYGSFENIRDGYLSFASWLSEHAHYRMEGRNRQICHRGPWNETTPENYLTEIQIPLQRQK